MRFCQSSIWYSLLAVDLLFVCQLFSCPWYDIVLLLEFSPIINISPVGSAIEGIFEIYLRLRVFVQHDHSDFYTLLLWQHCNDEEPTVV